MATPVVMPKLGNSVESSIIVGWKKQPGDEVKEGEPLLEVETDKATIDVESPASGTLLAIFFKAGEDVPVMTNIAAVGAPGEDYAALSPAGAVPASANEPRSNGAAAAPASEAAAPAAEAAPAPSAPVRANAPVSPRARKLVAARGISLEGVLGTGPGGRIIERDVLAALARQPKLTPVAARKVATGDFSVPEGAASRKLGSRDLVPSKSVPADAAPVPAAAPAAAAAASPADDGVQVFPLKGVRKVIATRMLQSLQTTAQLTLNAYADARALKALRERLKASDEALGLRGVTINDLVMFAVARTLTSFPNLNAHLKDEAIYQYSGVNLGFAVDTPRGLIVPVVQRAHLLSLRGLSAESSRLAKAVQDGTAKPEDLDGGTFTVTNLGGLGIETFTPVLNPPQVAILGVGGIALKPVEVGRDVQFIPHIGLSLTIDHRAVDGAPGARFLQALMRNLANADVLLAL